MFSIIDDLMTGGPVPAWTLSTQMVLLSASSLMVILSMLSRPPTSLTPPVWCCQKETWWRKKSCPQTDDNVVSWLGSFKGLTLLYFHITKTLGKIFDVEIVCEYNKNNEWLAIFRCSSWSSPWPWWPCVPLVCPLTRTISEFSSDHESLIFCPW